MAGQGGPLRPFPPPLPVDPWAALLASLPAPGAPMLPQLPDQAPFDPTQASVLDDPLTAAGRQMRGAMDSGELASIVSQASPAIAMVQREAQADLIARLMQSWAKAGHQMPGPIQEAITMLAQRFPRAMSHIQGVEPHPSVGNRVRGQFNPMPSDWNGRAGVIQVNPNQTPEQLLQTLTHELTHGGQQLRAVSRGTDLDALYSAFPEQYFTNPFEVRARTAQINQALRRRAPIAIMPEPTTPGARLKAATEHATNPFADEWMKR